MVRRKIHVNGLANSMLSNLVVTFYEIEDEDKDEMRMSMKMRMRRRARGRKSRRRLMVGRKIDANGLPNSILSDRFAHLDEIEDEDKEAAKTSMRVSRR